MTDADIEKASSELQRGSEPVQSFRPQPPPTSADLARWRSADEQARPRRLERLREALAAERIDAYFGVGRESARYLTGFDLADGEEKVAADSGRFLVSANEVVVFADSRYREQAEQECGAARIADVYHDLPERWDDLLGGLRPIDSSAGSRVRRVAVEADLLSHATWSVLAAAAPWAELVPARGWVEELRAVKEGAEIERIAAACAVADAALARVLPGIAPGQTEREIALRLEWEMRTGGAEALAFDVACLGGPRAALPHGSPSDRPVSIGEVLLFDFGAQVAGYRSDMTRTFFVGAPRDRDLEIYRIVAEAQERAIAVLEEAASSGSIPTGPDVDAVARRHIMEAGLGEHFGHGLGHGIGLATHELPTLSFRGIDVPLPTPTVFSIEPGVYLAGRTGIRIEDLVVFDVAARRLERLTRFPREATVIGA